MNKEGAIKYLQQLYPNGGHCWLDEQRIDAIGMAVKALQEELVSEDLEEAAKKYGTKKHPMTTIGANESAYDFKAGTKWQKTKDESCSKDLGDYTNELSKQFPEVSFAKLSRIAVRVAKWQKLKDMGITNNAKGVVTNILNSSDKSLDIYATEVAFIMLPANLTENYHMTNRDRISNAVRLGAKWQKANVWKPADGDDLPEIDREVIALIDNGKVVFAHRPDPKGWDAKSIITEKVEHYTPETYGKGGWNIPDVKWFLDVELPKEI